MDRCRRAHARVDRRQAYGICTDKTVQYRGSLGFHRPARKRFLYAVTWDSFPIHPRKGVLERKSDPTHKRSGSNGIQCGRTAVIHPVHGYNHMRYDFAVTQARTQGTAINLHGVHPSRWYLTRRWYPSRLQDNVMAHKQGQGSVPRLRLV